MTPKERAELTALLVDRLREADARAVAARIELGQVRTARADSVDDEHDPEGSTLSADWSRVDGLARSAVAQRAAIAAALDRVRGAGYGSCIRCGRSIDVERLRALPEAVHCIACARELAR